MTMVGQTVHAGPTVAFVVAQLLHLQPNPQSHSLISCNDHKLATTLQQHQKAFFFLFPFPLQHSSCHIGPTYLCPACWKL